MRVTHAYRSSAPSQQPLSPPPPPPRHLQQETLDASSPSLTNLTAPSNHVSLAVSPRGGRKRALAGTSASPPQTHSRLPPGGPPIDSPPFENFGRKKEATEEAHNNNNNNNNKQESRYLNHLNNHNNHNNETTVTTTTPVHPLSHLRLALALKALSHSLPLQHPSHDIGH